MYAGTRYNVYIPQHIVYREDMKKSKLIKKIWLKLTYNDGRNTIVDIVVCAKYTLNPHEQKQKVITYDVSITRVSLDEPPAVVYKNDTITDTYGLKNALSENQLPFPYDNYLASHDDLDVLRYDRVDTLVPVIDPAIIAWSRDKATQILEQFPVLFTQGLRRHPVVPVLTEHVGGIGIPKIPTVFTPQPNNTNLEEKIGIMRTVLGNPLVSLSDRFSDSTLDCLIAKLEASNRAARATPIKTATQVAEQRGTKSQKEPAIPRCIIDIPDLEFDIFDMRPHAHREIESPLSPSDEYICFKSRFVY
jgi:hypothetical protein